MPRLVIALPCLLISATALAQPAAQLDEFRPAVDSRGYLSLNGSSVLGHEEVSFGLGSLEWGRHLSGAVDLSIAIRTIVVTAAGASLGVGGAITALSDPLAEAAETRLKAAALLRALAAAGSAPQPDRPGSASVAGAAPAASRQPVARTAAAWSAATASRRAPGSSVAPSSPA